DLARPELTDPTLLAATRLTQAVMPVAYWVADQSMHAWLGLEALRIWLEHIARAIAAAIFGDPVGLARHTAAAMPLLPFAAGLYPIALARLLRGLALAGQVRAGHGDERSELLSELDEVTGWLAARAADAPDNFQHLLRLLEAERAWALGDFRAAALGFDAARREAAGRPRPWHRALITERAARFFLARSLDHAG